MSTHVIVNTYSYSVTYVTDKLLTSVKDIVRLSGLNPSRIAADWIILERGLRKWLDTRDLEELLLEVFDPRTSNLVGRWDFDIRYEFSGDGSFWIDPGAIRYHIIKQGCWPAHCEFRIMATTKIGRPDVEGWSRTTLRSTAGFVKQSIGTTIDVSGLSTGVAYWRRVS
jgi:hypothetical protein